MQSRNQLAVSGFGALVVLLGITSSAPAQQSAMSFFVTSAGPGKGADLGGLEGADAHCQKLAATVGAGGKTWRAYLSTNNNLAEPTKTVNARDRIGWRMLKNCSVLLGRRIVHFGFRIDFAQK